MQALVIGSGGIGGLYSALLHKAGWQIDLVARTDHALIAEQGLTVDSPLGELSYRPNNVYASTEQAGKADWVIVCVKMLDKLNLVELIKPVVNEHSVIVIIANGLDIEVPVAQAFPNNPLLSCVAFVGTHRVAPAHIKHSNYGHLVLGNYHKPLDEHASTLAAAFNSAGIQAKLSADVVQDRWKKSIWNASFNPFSVLTNGATTEQLLQAEPLLRAMMAEVIACARAEGYALADELIEKNLANTRTMGSYLTSMAVDYLNAAPIELEAILGSVVRYGEKHQLPVPHLNTLYQSLKIRYANA